MVWPLVAIGAVQAGISLYQGMSGSRKAKEAGKATADLIRMETAIAARRAERDLSDLTKQARAGAYASGVDVSGSTEHYLRKMHYRGYEGINDIRRIGAMQAKAAKKGGQVTGNSLMTQGIAGAVGSMASAYSSYYQGTQLARQQPTLTTPTATPTTGSTTMPLNWRVS